MVREARRFLRLQHRLGLADPWAPAGGAFDAAEARAWAVVMTLWPVATVGALLGWVPYRLTGLLAPRLTREDDVLGTLKLLLGALMIPATWAAECAVAGVLYGHRAALALAAVAPAAGYGALVFDEARARLRA